METSVYQDVAELSPWEGFFSLPVISALMLFVCCCIAVFVCLAILKKMHLSEWFRSVSPVSSIIVRASDHMIVYSQNFADLPNGKISPVKLEKIFGNDLGSCSQLLNIAERVIANHSSEPYECRLKGSRIRSSVAWIRWQRKEFWLWSWIDIEKELRHKEEAEEAANHLRSALESITDGVISISPDGRIEMCNAAAEQIFARNRNAMIGMPFESLFALTDKAGNDLAFDWKGIMVSGLEKTLPAETMMTLPDGRQIQIAVSGSPMRMSSGEITGVIVVFRDTTEEVALRERVQQEAQFLLTAANLGGFNYFLLRGRKAIAKFPQKNLNWGFDSEGNFLPYTLWVYHDDVEKFKTAFRQLFDKKATEAIVHYRSNYSGKMQYFVMRLCRDTTLGDDFVIGSIQNITQEQVEKEKLENTVREFETFFHNFPCALMIKNASDHYRYYRYNAKFIQDYGLADHGDFIGKSDFDIFPADIAEVRRERDRRAVRMPERDYCFLDDTPVLSNVAKTRFSMKKAVRGPDGNVFLIVTGFDASELVAGREALLHELQSLRQHRSESRTLAQKFFSEFRQCLESIQSASEPPLRDGGLLPEQRQAWAIVRDGIRNCMAWNDDFYAWASWDETGQASQRAWIDLHDVFEQIRDSFGAADVLEYRCVTLSVLEPLPRLRMDFLRLERAWHHLVVYVLSVSAPGTMIRSQVEFLAADACAGMLRISVQAAGDHGLNDYCHSELLQNEQLCDSIHLNFAREVVERLGGFLSISGEPGVTSSFSLIFTNVLYSNSGGMEPIPVLLPALRGPYTVLMVDDNEMHLTILRAILQALGVQCITSLSGEQALVLMRKNSVQLVLTDLWMPLMTGDEFATLIRRNPDYQAIPVVAITADPEADFTVFDGVLTKPVSFTAIRDLIIRFRKPAQAELDASNGSLS